MAKANIDVRNSHKSTPLHEAATNDKKEVLEFLLTNGANVDARDKNGRTPLHEAIVSGAEDAVALLVGYRANVNAQDLKGLTPIGAATEDDIDKKIVSVLVNAGADVNITNCNGDTPLHLIAGYSDNEGVEKIVRLLIERGINVNVQNRENRTPLHCAINTGEVETVRLLVEEYKANVNAMDHNRNTPIHLLYERIRVTECIESVIEMVKILIENGASFNAPNEEGRTFLHEIVADRDNISEYGNNDYYELVRTMVGYTILENPELEKPYYIIAKEEISECWDEISDEIEKMRARNIDGTVTFYDILVSKDINELASYIQNKNVTKELEAKNYKSQFPLYANKIESQFHKGKIRKELLDKGEESIRKLVNIGHGIELPPELVCRKAVKYLPNEDIENLNKAVENLLDKRGIKRKASLEKGESSTKHFAASYAEEPNSNLNDTSEGNLNEARNVGWFCRIYKP